MSKSKKNAIYSSFDSVSSFLGFCGIASQRELYACVMILDLRKQFTSAIQIASYISLIFSRLHSLQNGFQ